MSMPSLFVALVYLSGYLFLIFCAICLACGLMYCVELAEEHTVLTRKIIRVLIFIQLILHPLLYFYEHFPFLPTILGFLSHLSYLLLLQTFPFIHPTSFNALASLVLFLISNILYLRFFTSDNNNDLFYIHRVAPLPALAAFFLVAVWLVPLAFFVSLTVNDSVLPGAGVDEPMMGKKKKSKSVIAAAATAIKDIVGSDRNHHQRLQF